MPSLNSHNFLPWTSVWGENHERSRSNILVFAFISPILRRYILAGSMCLHVFISNDLATLFWFALSSLWIMIQLLCNIKFLNYCVKQYISGDIKICDIEFRSLGFTYRTFIASFFCEFWPSLITAVHGQISIFFNICIPITYWTLSGYTFQLGKHLVFYIHNM